jgi:choline dehydrogenase-like flavoprotein
MAREYLLGNGWFGRTVFEAGAFVKSRQDASIPDIQIHTLPWGYPTPNQDGPQPPDIDKGHCLTVMPTLIYPKSRGSLRLASSDPAKAPLIDPRFLEDPEDVLLLLTAIRKCREICAHPAMADHLAEELTPGAQRSSDAELVEEIRLRATTVYHPVGTCRMGLDEMAVVDPKLKVRGVEGLRIADASIMPQITGGNTNAPSMMIGERAAAWIQDAR